MMAPDIGDRRMAEPVRQQNVIPGTDAPSNNSGEGHVDSGPNQESHVTTTALDAEKVIGAELIDVSVDDENTVGWDGENDPANPYNWPRWKKTINIGLLFTLSLTIPLASPMFNPAVPSMMKSFDSNSPALTGFVASDSALGNMFGPLLVAPLSEIYGRIPVYHTCNILFVVVSLGCAFSPSLAALIVFRFLVGAFGCSPLIIGSGILVDIVKPEHRGPLVAVWTVGPLLGPLIGPVLGGQIAGNLGWRWIFKFTAISNSIVIIPMLFLLSESYAPVLLHRKTLKLRRETGNALLRSKLDTGLSNLDYLKHGFIRPFKILVRSPYALVIAVQTSFMAGIISLVLTSLAPMFARIYHTSTSNLGLVFLGYSGGSWLGLFHFGFLTYRMKEQVKKDEGDVTSRVRLKPFVIGSMFLPVGFLLYGWTMQYQAHWIVPILTLSLVGFGLLLIIMSTMMALIDAFKIYSASATAGSIVMRDIFTATMPLFAIQMYDALGMGWGNSLVALIALFLVPAAFLIMKYGDHLRKTYPVKDI